MEGNGDRAVLYAIEDRPAGGMPSRLPPRPPSRIEERCVCAWVWYPGHEFVRFFRGVCESQGTGETLSCVPCFFVRVCAVCLRSVCRGGSLYYHTERRAEKRPKGSRPWRLDVCRENSTVPNQYVAMTRRYAAESTHYSSSWCRSRMSRAILAASSSSRSAT